MIEIDYETWAKEYKPIKNHIDPDAGFNGELFETYGEEVLFVLGCPKNKVWTWTDGEFGTFIADGYNYVNRIGYLVTEKPAIEGEIYEIKVDDYGSDYEHEVVTDDNNL